MEPSIHIHFGQPAENNMSANWMAGAVKRPGQLHRDLGIKQGERIPPEMVRSAASKPGKLGQRARFALAAAKVRKGKK